MIPETRPAAIVASAYSSIAAAATWSSPFEFVGLPAPVVFMAFAGVAAGLILQPPKNMSRLAMFMLTLALTFFAAVSTVVLGHIPKMDWVRDAGPAIAGTVGLFAQALVPALQRRLQKEVNDRGATTSSGGGSP